MKVKNGTQQADLGLKQNVRRAEGQAVNAAAGALEMAKSFDDSILFWNEVTIEVFSNAATTGEQPGPALGSRALSIVHLAMYDAYAGALGNPAYLPKYLPQLEPAPLAAKASPKATVAGAAYESLLRLYPRQKALLDAQLLSFCDGANGPLGLVALQPSLVYGAYVANSLLLQRAGDPIGNIAVPYASYTPPAGVNVGHWYEPDPVTPDLPLYAPYYGATNPLFASTQRFTIDPVASIGSAEINAGYTYVSTLGIASFLNETSPVNGVSYPKATRTPTQNITATYWVSEENPETERAREILESKNNTKTHSFFNLSFLPLFSNTGIRRPEEPGNPAWPLQRVRQEGRRGQGEHRGSKRAPVCLSQRCDGRRRDSGLGDQVQPVLREVSSWSIVIFTFS